MKTARFIIWILYGLFVASSMSASAAPVPLAWDAKPAEVITRTDVFRIDPVTKLAVWLASSATSEVMVDLPPGTHEIRIASENAVGWSVLSDVLAVTVEPVEPVQGFRVIVESSGDLTEWTPEIEILNQPPGRKFWRIKIVKN